MKLHVVKPWKAFAVNVILTSIRFAAGWPVTGLWRGRSSQINKGLPLYFCRKRKNYFGTYQGWSNFAAVKPSLRCEPQHDFIVVEKGSVGGSLYDVKQRGRPPKAPMAKPKKRDPQTELEKLQAENLRLRAENALLKKVKALVEEQKARARLNGQKPSTN